MPKPKKELLDLSTICSATHAKGHILEVETEIAETKKAIVELKKVFDIEAQKMLFNGFSFSKIKELAINMGDLAWVIKQYRNAISEIKAKWGV